mgnify:CR=1 FL=1
MQDTAEEAYGAAVLASMEDEYPISEAVVERAYRTAIVTLAISTIIAYGSVAVLLWMQRDDGLVITSTALAGFSVLLLVNGAWLRPWLRSIRVLRSAEGFHVSFWPHTRLCKTLVAPGPTGVIKRYTNAQGDTVAVALGYGGLESPYLVMYGFTHLDDVLDAIQASRESVTLETLPWGREEEQVHYKRPRRLFLITALMAGFLPTAAAIVAPFEGYAGVGMGVAAVFFASINLLNWVLVVEYGGGLAGNLLKLGLTFLSWLYILVGMVAWVRWWTG